MVRGKGLGALECYWPNSRTLPRIPAPRNPNDWDDGDDDDMDTEN